MTLSQFFTACLIQRFNWRPVVYGCSTHELGCMCEQHALMVLLHTLESGSKPTIPLRQKCNSVSFSGRRLKRLIQVQKRFPNLPSYEGNFDYFLPFY